jgi:DNA-binding response OmpR family regulator
LRHTILFAEDDDELREAICDQLVEAGYTVTTAADGQHGLHVLRHVKERTPATRVIMLTGVDDFTVAIESVKLGANDYITKPFRLEDLLARIKKFLTH